MVLCCRCNRTGSCRGCACVKARRQCSNCLPSKLGSCSNIPSTPTPSIATPTMNQSATNTMPSLTLTSNSSYALSGSAISAQSALRGNGATGTPGAQSDSATSTQQADSISCPPCPQHLPTFQPMNTPVFSWGIHNAEDFFHALEATYSEVVYWRMNSFKVHTGKAGKEFTNELSRLFLALASASSMETVALKAATVLLILLLQKPHHRSKAKEHVACLERRLSIWKEGNLNDLTLEGRTIQSRLRKFNQFMAKQNLSRSFANLMFVGKTKAALDLLSQAQKGGVLHLSDPSDPNNPDSPTVRDILKSKHPQGQYAHAECIIPSAPQDVHSVVFDSIDANAIRSAALRTTGSAGPSGLDAHEWRRLCTAFKGASTDLCNSLALVAKRLCKTYIDPKCVSPFLTCRLIALDKSPGFRPIGIGDTVR